MYYARFNVNELCKMTCKYIVQDVTQGTEQDVM